MGEATRAGEVAVAVAGVGLADGERDGSIEVPAEAWLGALDLISHQRLSGLAVAAVAADRLRLTDPQHEELLGRHREAMVLALALERRLLALESAFREQGLDVLVLKGPASAHSFYPDPSWRAFGDLDLLVRTRDWAAACALLEERGFRRKYPDPRPGFVERFGHTAVHVDAEGLELDLHRTLIAGPVGQWVDQDELFEGAATFRVGGRTLRRLGDTMSLLHACVHAALGARPPLLVPLRDVIQVSSLAAVDWDHLARRAERWNLRAVLRFAFASTRVLGGEAPPEAAALVHAPIRRVDRRALAAYTSRRSRGGKALGTLRAVHGIRGKAAYLWALLFPSRRFLETRAGGGRSSYLRRWTTPVRWLARRGG